MEQISTFFTSFKMSERSGTKRKRHDSREKVKPKPVPEAEKPKTDLVKTKLELVKTEPESVVKKEEFSDDEETPLTKVKAEPNLELSRQCPYLDTIDRNLLDFGKTRNCSPLNKPPS